MQQCTGEHQPELTAAQSRIGTADPFAAGELEALTAQTVVRGSDFANRFTMLAWPDAQFGTIIQYLHVAGAGIPAVT